MLSSTIEVIRSAMKADSTISPEERTRLIALLRSPKQKPETEKQSDKKAVVLQRCEVAQRFGRSLRFVDRLAKSGVLRKVTIPGHKRATGFRESDVEALIAGNQAVSAA